MSFGRCSITSGNLNVRASASSSGNILFTIKRDEVATILSSSGNWYRIDHPNGIGYVSKDYFDVIGNPLTTITVATESSSGNLNIRSGPGTTYPVVFQAANGTSLNMHEEGNSWTLVSYGDQIGWGSNDFLQYQGGSVPGGSDNHRNADYTAADIANGYATWYNDGTTNYSADIYQLQLNLALLGYLKSDGGRRDGRGIFGEYTEQDVLDFQDCFSGLAEDGVVGTNTYLAIQYALNNPEYFSIGKPLASSEWGQDRIASGALAARDALARVIYAEDKKENSQRLIACVINERTKHSSEMRTGVENKWLAVLSRVYSSGTPAFTTANPDNSQARSPVRGKFDDESTPPIFSVYPAWEHAVDFADILDNDNPISSPVVYKIEGENYHSTPRTYNGQLNFKNYPNYLDDYEDGKAENAICIYSSRSMAENVEDDDHTVVYTVT